MKDSVRSEIGRKYLEVFSKKISDRITADDVVVIKELAIADGYSKLYFLGIMQILENGFKMNIVCDELFTARTDVPSIQLILLTLSGRAFCYKTV